MSYLSVNGQRIPEEVIQMEVERLSLDPNLQRIADLQQRSLQARGAAEHSVICRALVEQTAAADPRPIDPGIISKEVERRKTLGACRSAFDDGFLRQEIEKQMRIDRSLADLSAGAKRPSADDVRAFYDAHGHNFRAPEMFHAAHIVKHVNENQTEQQARTGIRAALEELENGEEFSAVAERWSDCKGNGGDLGVFARGTMVPEFEDVLLSLKSGSRSDIFTTPFGFHIAELRDRQTGGSADFESVRADIERVMNTMAEHQAFIAAVEKLRLQADVKWEETDAAMGAAISG